MSKQIRSQADKVWQIIKDPATGATYTQTASTTGTILKETGYLLWLVICLVLVFGDWIWRSGYRTGWSTREWINNFDKPSPDRLAQDAGQNLLQASKAAVMNAISTAKEQLGIENQPEPLLATASSSPESTPPATKPTPPSAKPTPPATEPTPSTPDLKPSSPPPTEKEDLDPE